jgi:four helix bundle protein
MKIKRFEELEIWRLSIDLTKEIYKITGKEDFSRDFSLKDQIRRAVVSISSNIVEGFEKNNNNELTRFLRISKGSAGEVRNQLYVALEIGYIEKSEFENLNSSFIELASQIGKFISYLDKHKKLKTRKLVNPQ